MSMNNEQLAEILVKLDQLIELTKTASKRPNLTVNADFKVAGRIYEDLSRDSLTCSGL